MIWLILYAWSGLSVASVAALYDEDLIPGGALTLAIFWPLVVPGLLLAWVLYLRGRL